MIPVEDFTKFCLLWAIRPPNWEHARFGQAFCNYFNITNPDIYYAPDDVEAWELIKSTISS